MKTKEKILRTALRLYNAQGTEQVTSRHIAAELGIQDGNLRYHFPKRADLVEALYFQLVASFDQNFTELMGPAPSLRLMYDFLYQTYSLLYQYRFLMVDFAGIMRRYPKLKNHFSTLIQGRKMLYQQISTRFVAAGLIHPPRLPNEYEWLAGRLQILSDFWLSSAEILYDGPESQKIDHYVQLSLSAFLPYLTGQGLEEFQQLTGTTG
ncbi:MAG: TetR/AcrR family transcriptional regulator [Bacteroidota bacterium]